MVNLMIQIWYHKSWRFILEIQSKFKKFDLRQLQESIYSGTQGVFDFCQQFDLCFSDFLNMFYLCKHRVQEQSKILKHRGSNTNGVLHIWNIRRRTAGTSIYGKFQPFVPSVHLFFCILIYVAWCITGDSGKLSRWTFYQRLSYQVLEHGPWEAEYGNTEATQYGKN